MSRSENSLSVLLTFIAPFILISSVAAQTSVGFQFEDVGNAVGLFPAAKNIQAHGAGWGDVDNDGWADLYVATFHYGDTKPNFLLRNKSGKFVPADQPVNLSTRGTGVVFVDLDNDNDLDLYVASMPAPAGSKLSERHGHPFSGCSMFKNDGSGNFTNISEGNTACPLAFGGRSATVLDYDGDGLLDLLVGEEPTAGYNGSPTTRSRLFHNLGQLKFEDVTDEVGIPADAAGLGVAVGDVNLDSWPDIFLASTIGNHLLLNDQKGKFIPFSDPEVFAWPEAKGDNMVCGVAIADVNKDRLPDIVIGQHFDHPWKEPVANRLYLNRGSIDGGVNFEDITESAGLVPLPLKAPHVEIQDFNNDGHMDIFSSIVTFADGAPHPLIFAGLGDKDGIPQFAQKAIGVNDFPNDEDRATKRSGQFFEKMLAERKVIYAAPAPSCDFDRDGKLDIFFGSWWSNAPSMLLRNTTPDGHWIDVVVLGNEKVNLMGIGTRVDLYPAGRAKQSEALLGSKEIATGFGYASSQQAIAHFGLANDLPVDVVLTLPHNAGEQIVRQLQVNQRQTIQLNETE